MISSTKFSALILMTLICITTQAMASDGELTSSLPNDNRTHTKFGTYLSILGDPAPTLVGINAAYNLTDFLRLHAGYGQVSVTDSVSLNGSQFTSSTASMTTLGGGALAMVPGWNLTPVAGLSYSHVFLSGSGIFSVSPDNVYATVGVDWQAHSGFNLGAGFNMALAGQSSGGYVNLGWFFL